MPSCLNCLRKVKKANDLKQVTGFGSYEVSGDLPDSALGATGWPCLKRQLQGSHAGALIVQSTVTLFVVVKSGECGLLCKEKTQKEITGVLVASSGCDGP